MFKYLSSVAYNCFPYDVGITWWDKVCIFILNLFYKDRYAEHFELLRLRALVDNLRKDNERYIKKLTYTLNVYAKHIGEPAYSMTWGTLKMSEETESIVTAKLSEPLYLDLGDAEFMQQARIEEEK